MHTFKQIAAASILALIIGLAFHDKQKSAADSKPDTPAPTVTTSPAPSVPAKEWPAPEPKPATPAAAPAQYVLVWQPYEYRAGRFGRQIRTGYRQVRMSMADYQRAMAQRPATQSQPRYRYRYSYSGSCAGGSCR